MLEPLIFEVNGLFHRYRMNLLPMNVSLIQNRTPFLFYTGPLWFLIGWNFKIRLKPHHAWDGVFLIWPSKTRLVVDEKSKLSTIAGHSFNIGLYGEMKKKFSERNLKFHWTWIIIEWYLANVVCLLCWLKSKMANIGWQITMRQYEKNISKLFQCETNEPICNQTCWNVLRSFSKMCVFIILIRK